MNNTEELLRAFIEASGYEVEETSTIALNGKPLEKPSLGLAGGLIPVKTVKELRSIITITDYKVTKKADHLHEWHDDVPLNQLVKNVIELSTIDAELRWIKYPKSSFYAVIKWFGDAAKRVNEHRYEILGVEVSLDEG